MVKNKTFSGSWSEYLDEILKSVTEEVVQKNWSTLIESWELEAPISRALKWLKPK